MAQLVDIQRLEVGPRSLVATVRIADDAPLMTSDDLEGTTRVYNLMPHIIEHACYGDGGETFRDVMGNTELAHLLEHMTVELLALSGIAGEISAGRTRSVGSDGRTFEIELACPDDVLVAGALASACWVMTWAFSGGGDPEPDVEGTVNGLVALVNSLPQPDAAAAAPHQGASSALQVVPGGVTEPAPMAGEDTGLDGPTMDVGVRGAVAPSHEDTTAPAHDEPASELPPRESPEGRQAATASPTFHALESSQDATGRIRGGRWGAAQMTTTPTMRPLD